ncbi:MAG TPA: MurR/RpiR family transcriptional regulator [Gaiellales bacterium]|jgi:DNA-binding MurR/RpiR family transcriptional regulator|nr:MurR/RpiR family transcriptional regulator [Gaiellales bacterium]
MRSPIGSQVAGLIRARLDDLSPNDRRIARQILDHYIEAPFETAESLAAKSGVSKAAVVRFATRIGFPGFTELHESLRAEAVERLRRTDEEQPGETADGVLGRWVERARADLASTRVSIDGAEFDSAVRLLTRGNGKLGIFGHRKSAALAEYAYYLLNPLIANVWPIAAGEPGIADHLIDLEPRDRLLAFTFKRYAKLTADVVREFHQAGAPSVLITDDLMAPAAGIATHTLVCRPAEQGGFETAAAGMVVLEALAAEIALRKRRSSGRRLDAAEHLWKQFGTY